MKKPVIVATYLQEGFRDGGNFMVTTLEDSDIDADGTQNPDLAVKFVLGEFDETTSGAIALLTKAITNIARNTTEGINFATGQLFGIFVRYHMQLSEGFASVINASQTALHGTGTLTQEQLQVLLHVLTAVKNNPFIPFGSALELIDRLDKVNLDTMMPQLNELASAIAEAAENDPKVAERIERDLKEDAAAK